MGEYKDKIGVSVVVPAFNEEACIEKTLRSIGSFLKSSEEGYEIIVVDDCSYDGTSDILGKMEGEGFPVVIIKNEENRGKGFSVRRGCLAARGKVVGFMDADSSVVAEEIEKFVSVIKSGEFDLTIASRKEEESRILKSQAWYREKLGAAGNGLVRSLLKIDIKDTQCGFKFFSCRFVEDIFPQLSVDRWLFDVEILKAAEKYKYGIKVLPVDWTHIDGSSVNLGSYLGALRDVLKIRKKWLS
ncbi:MAG: glycosyltransferase family 2 protein [Candidatus Pacebacteria bacterium]|nr:glycosyltransferase family 2 protein [Candidatus Paceibacterota bacterium]